VLAEEARRSMIAYRYETAIATAGEAVFLAREVGDEQIEADVLVTRGVARVSAGDAAGVDELRQALELVGHRGRVASRGYVNLGVALATIGDFQEAGRVFAQGLERAELEGDEQGAWFARGNLVGNCYSTGDWDEALRHADAFREAPEGARYMEPAVQDTRLRIAAARGDPAAGLDEMRAVVERSRSLGDEQSVWPSLLALASMARRAGLHDERNAIVAELVAALAGHDSVGDPQEWHVELMLALRDTGEHAAATSIATRIPAGPWQSACDAVVRGADVEAADVLETIGEQPIQALLRARAARAFLAEGRSAEAEAELGRARAFWHSVGAVALLRELEEVLAAAS
jgi:tetratricopeptide (TPR) repeat protein